jgi:hypothetical protein
MNATRSPQQRFDALPFNVKDAVRNFRDQHGRTWKSKLRDLWMRSHHCSGELLTVRNVIGPTDLSRITL